MSNATITLSKPLPRGDKYIEVVELREPMSGELRGLHLADLFMMKTDAVMTLVPRISNPALTAADMAALSPKDLGAIALEIVGFFTPSTATP
ncbi:MAG: phage tail assembly protein [Thiohalomonadaceae bacterium]